MKVATSFGKFRTKKTENEAWTVAGRQAFLIPNQASGSRYKDEVTAPCPSHITSSLLFSKSIKKFSQTAAGYSTLALRTTHSGNTTSLLSSS
jgi:hypothetical protein